MKFLTDIKTLTHPNILPRLLLLAPQPAQPSDFFITIPLFQTDILLNFVSVLILPPDPDPMNRLAHSFPMVRGAE
jgi:hypothetical protein